MLKLSAGSSVSIALMNEAMFAQILMRLGEDDGIATNTSNPNSGAAKTEVSKPSIYGMNCLL